MCEKKSNIRCSVVDNEVVSESVMFTTPLRKQNTFFFLPMYNMFYFVFLILFENKKVIGWVFFSLQHPGNIGPQKQTDLFQNLFL